VRVSVGKCPPKVNPPCPSPNKMATTSNPVQLTAKSMFPSWLKSPATSNSGAMMLPVRWLAKADGRNAAERIKQANAENCIFFIFFLPTFTESRSDQPGDKFQYFRPEQSDLRLNTDSRPSLVSHRH